jgi:thiol-disulfide isomerase/thioredoxin
MYRKFQRLPKQQKLVVIAALVLGGYWLYKNHGKSISTFCGGGQRHHRREMFHDQAPKKVTCTMYYTNGCPHCVEAKPKWDKFAQLFNGKKVGGAQLVIAKIDCEKYPEVAQQQGIKGFPTFKFDFDGQVMEYQGERTVDGWKKYIENVMHSDHQ